MTQQVKSITSEALEAAYRNLTPSQQGFTEDLMASNTIIPILDLTASAEGTTTPSYLTRAWDYSTGSAKVDGPTPATLVTVPGFWQINAIYTADTATLSVSTPVMANLSLTDGVTPKTVWELYRSNANTDSESTILDAFVVFVASGYSLTAYTQGTGKILAVQYRQIADVNGNIINPLGYTPQ